ncbi:MAG TPA: hypothetical protein VNT55_04935 [Baekduia sp.]|nr:hypothetical protein [Baekduia sp.]
MGGDADDATDDDDMVAAVVEHVDGEPSRGAASAQRLGLAPQARQ